MDVIKSYPTNGVTSVAAAPVDSDWPASNMLDEHPKQACKSEGQSLSSSFILSSGCNALALFNLEAESATIAISSSTAIPLTLRTGVGAVTLRTGVGAVTLLASSEESSAEIFDATKGQLWVEYTAINNTHRIDVDLTAASGSIAKIGTAAGQAKLNYKDPMINIKESAVDYSIVRELHGGEIHITDRDAVRAFGFSFRAKRNDATVNNAWHFLNTLYHTVKSHPIAWRLNSVETDEEWVVFAKFDGPPYVTHTYRWSLLTVSLLEVL